MDLSDEERSYVITHWDLIGRLRRTLRTERDVRLAVLFGSFATGSDRPTSDVDLLVVRRSDSARARAALSLRLSRALGKRVHLVDLGDARRSHALMSDVLCEGRPVLDRDGLWATLLAWREEVLAGAEAEDSAAPTLSKSQRRLADIPRRIPPAREQLLVAIEDLSSGFSAQSLIAGASKSSTRPLVIRGSGLRRSRSSRSAAPRGYRRRWACGTSLIMHIHQLPGMPCTRASSCCSRSSTATSTDSRSGRRAKGSCL